MSMYSDRTEEKKYMFNPFYIFIIKMLVVTDLSTRGAVALHKLLPVVTQARPRPSYEITWAGSVYETQSRVCD